MFFSHSEDQDLCEHSHRYICVKNVKELGNTRKRGPTVGSSIKIIRVMRHVYIIMNKSHALLS